MEQGKIMEAEVPTVRVGASPTGLTAPPPTQPPKVFYRPDALPAAQPTVSKHSLLKYGVDEFILLFVIGRLCIV